MEKERKNQLHTIRYFLVCLLCTLGFVFAGNQISVSAKTVTTNVTIRKGKTYKIEQSLSSKAKYKTSNKRVATAKNGKITAKAIGSAKITITDKGNTYIYKVKVSKVYLSKQSVVINKGKSITLKVKGTSRKAKWTSSNKSVATVKNGRITAKKVGTATITAKVNGVTLKCKIKVENPVLNKTKLTIEKGESSLLTVKGTSGTVKWTSSNKNVATVKNGKVTAKNAGTATISAKVNDATLKCQITVTDDITDNEDTESPETPEKPDEDTEDETDSSDDAETACYLDKTSITWGFGETDESIWLRSFVRLVNNTDSNVVWTSSNTDIVQIINNYGNYVQLYRGKRGGTATITAVANGKTYSCNVTNYSLLEDNHSAKEGTLFDFATYTSELQTALGVTLTWTWDRTDLIQKKTTIDGTVTNYLVEGSGTTVITGVSSDGYTKVQMNVTTTGTYIDKKGTYNEALTNEVYELLKLDAFTRNETYVQSEQLEFLLATADRWYNGEISERTTANLMHYTPFENSINCDDNYGVKSYFVTEGCKTITISNVSTADEIVDGINSYMGYPDGTNESGWTWCRCLLYLKIHTDGDNVYVYMIP